MSRSKERITVRLSATDINGLKKLQASGSFEDISVTVRWCIHFTITMMRSIPSTLINSFAEIEKNEVMQECKVENDSLENAAGEVQEPQRSEKV